MSAYIIVSASTPGKPLGVGETTDAIAAALGVSSLALEAHSEPLIGRWDGQREYSRALPMGHPGDVLAWRHVHATAYHLRLALGQDAVMVLADRASDMTEANMGEVFENVERVGIFLPTQDEVRRDSLATSAQASGDPIIPGVRNGSAWTTRADEHGDYMMALV